MQNNTYEFTPFEYIDRDKMVKTGISEDDKLKALEDIGFEVCNQNGQDNKLRFEFNPTSFAEYFSTCVIGRLLENGDIALYRRKDGYYEIVDELVLGKLMMVLMTQGGQKLWSKSRESQCIEGYKRLLNEMVVQFDTEDIINLKNGIFDMVTRTLKHHDPKHLCLGQIDTLYDPEAQARVFEKFIDEICCHDPELVKVLTEIIGYAISRSIKAEKGFFFPGIGGNGKSTLLYVLYLLIGPHNISAVSLEMLSDSFGLETMVGKYVNIASENEIEGNMRTEKIKSIISGDLISIARKYKKALSIHLRCTLIHVVNTLPPVSDMTKGFWRKIMIFPFNAIFNEEKADKFLPEKLAKETSGILNIALTGLSRLEKNNYVFSHSTAISKIYDEYELSQKSGIEFMLENYDTDPENRIFKTTLYEDFSKWARENGKVTLTPQKFWNMLESYWKEKAIFYDYKKVNGSRHLVGFVEKHDDEEAVSIERLRLKAPMGVQNESISA